MERYNKQNKNLNYRRTTNTNHNNYEHQNKICGHDKHKAEGKTKTQYLLNNTTWKPGTSKTYMNKLTRMEASTIFKARTRMLDVKNNYRGKHNNVTCRKCGETTETQEHILDECKGIHTNNTTIRLIYSATTIQI